MLHFNLPHLPRQLTLGHVLDVVGKQETSIAGGQVAAGVKVDALQHELVLNLEQISAHSIIAASDAAKNTQLGLTLVRQHRIGALQREVCSRNQKPVEAPAKRKTLVTRSDWDSRPTYSG